MAEIAKGWSLELLKAVLIAAVTVYANVKVIEAKIEGLQRQADQNTKSTEKNRDMIIEGIRRGASKL